MEKELWSGVLTIESMNEQVRSKYKLLAKRMSLKDNEMALNAHVKNTRLNNKEYLKKKQRFKVICKICGGYRHNTCDCWEKDENKRKGEP